MSETTKSIQAIQNRLSEMKPRIQSLHSEGEAARKNIQEVKILLEEHARFLQSSKGVLVVDSFLSGQKSSEIEQIGHVPEPIADSLNLFVCEVISTHEDLYSLLLLLLSQSINHEVLSSEHPSPQSLLETDPPHPVNPLSPAVDLKKPSHSSMTANVLFSQKILEAVLSLISRLTTRLKSLEVLVSSSSPPSDCGSVPADHFSEGGDSPSGSLLSSCPSGEFVASLPGGAALSGNSIAQNQDFESIGGINGR